MQIKNSIFIIIFVLFCGCNNNSKSKTGIEEAAKDMISLVEIQSKEDFQSFFSQFQQDSVFQLARIEFPLTIHIYEFDDSGDTLVTRDREVIINREERKYQNLKIFNRKIFSKISENKYNVELHIEDTGVRITYIFELDNDKWYLVEIKDESN